MLVDATPARATSPSGGRIDGVHVTRVGTIGAVGSVHVAPAFAAWLRRIARGSDRAARAEPVGAAVLRASRVRRRRWSIWYHSDVGAARAAVRALLRAARAVSPTAAPRRFIVSSPRARRARRARSRRTGSRVRVIPFGIDPAELGRRSTAIARARTDDHARRPVRAVRRTARAYKGVDVLLRALQGTPARAVIAGDGPHAPAWEPLAARARRSTDASRFTGEVPTRELRALLHACAAFVLPSVTRAEAFGYVQLEAMACGKPVISTDVPERRVVGQPARRTGLVVPRRRCRSACARRSTRLMADARAARALGRRGRARVEQEFTLARLRERLRGVLRRARGRRGRGRPRC